MSQLTLDAATPPDAPVRTCERFPCEQPATDDVRWGPWLGLTVHLCHAHALDGRRKPR